MGIKGIPMPEENENHSDFIERCIIDFSVEHYDAELRYRICEHSWDIEQMEDREIAKEFRDLLKAGANLKTTRRKLYETDKNKNATISD